MNDYSRVRMYLGTGGETWSQPVFLPVPASVYSTAVADFNADGKLDYVVASFPA